MAGREYAEARTPAFDLTSRVPRVTATETEKADRFMRLLSQHQSQVYGYIMALVHDLEDTRDVFQQASLVMWQKFDTFETGTNFLGWACSVSRFEAMNYLRTRRRLRARLGEALLDELTLAASEVEEPPGNDRQDALQGCLGKLAPAERRLVDDCYSSGAVIKNIASQLGRTSQSVCNSLRRIRLKLMECIDRARAQDHS